MLGDDAVIPRQVRQHNVLANRRLAVLDDDPTGSQGVHGVSVVTVLEQSAYATGLADPGDTAFILTNSRSLCQPEAVALARSVARDLFTWAADQGIALDLISRGDSTLRGHVVAEIEAIATERLAVTGEATDGVLLCPAMLEAGRFTVDNTQFATVDGVPTPVGETEFARDRTFGYISSNLRAFLAEQSGGRIRAADVASLSLADIRHGGPQRVAALLAGLSGQQWIVINATEHSDLDTVALGMRLAQHAGTRFLVRSGPSFVRALAGIVTKPPLASSDLVIDPSRSQHGLIVVGSHVGLTTRQLAVLLEHPDLRAVELRVPALIDGTGAAAHLDQVVTTLVNALRTTDAVVFTSRELATGSCGRTSLDLARTVSAALVEVVRRVREARPAWIIAKGGITGHDVAIGALGIRRGIVAGQFFAGQVSLLNPVDAPEEVLGCPYVIFPGNVGEDDALAQVHAMLAAQTVAAQAGPALGRASFRSPG